MPPLRISRRRAIAASVVVLLLIPVLLFAATAVNNFNARHRRDLAANPGDLHFRLSLQRGSAVDAAAFHIGERIPLTLEFWSDSLNKFELQAATYDRSGRLPT
jgi:hypothetical protein